jgi:hypothetical protein
VRSDGTFASDALDYLADRQQFLREQRERLEGKVAGLLKLDGEALVETYVPETKPVEAIPLSEAVGGQRAPTVKIMNLDEPRPTHRTGPEIGMAIPGGGPEG